MSVDITDSNMVKPAKRKFDKVSKELKSDGQNKKKKHDAGNQFKVFINRLNQVSMKSAVKEAMSVFGNVTDTYLPMDPDTQGVRNNRNKGFGFITFDNANAVEEALKAGFVMIDSNKVKISQVTDQKPKSDASVEDAPPTLHISKILDTTIKETLKKYLESFGTLKKFVWPKKTNKKGSKYALVNYEDVSISKQVLEGDHNVDGATLVIAVKKSELPQGPKKHTENIHRVHIGNVPTDVTKEALHQHFQQYGTVDKVLRPYDRFMERIRNFAFVQFTEFKSIGKALNGSNNVLGGVELTVKFNPDDDRLDKMPKRGHCVCVSNVCPDTAHDVYKKHFAAYGRLANLNWPVDKDNGAQRTAKLPYMYVCYAEEQALEKALAKRKHKVDGRTLLLTRRQDASNKTEKKGGSALLVTKIPYAVHKKAIEDHFAKLGAIKSLVMPYDSKQRHHKEHAYLTYDDEALHDKALALPHMIAGAKVAVERNPKTSDGGVKIEAAAAKTETTDE